MHPPEDYYVKQEKKNAKEIILKKEKFTYEKSLFEMMHLAMYIFVNLLL